MCALRFRLGCESVYDRLRHRCPSAVRGLSLRTFRREVRSLGFPAAHRRRGNCYCMVEV